MTVSPAASTTHKRRPTARQFKAQLRPESREVLDAIVGSRKVVPAPGLRYARIIGHAGQAIAYAFPTTRGIALDYMPDRVRKIKGAGTFEKGAKGAPKLTVRSTKQIERAKHVLDLLEGRSEQLAA